MTEYKLPEDLKYNKDYSWIDIEDEKAKVGIIKPAADKVKQFVFIDLPEEGEKIEKGDTYASVEAVKWSGHLSSPFTGEVIEVKQDIFDEPTKLNEEPYKNWIMKIKIDKPEEKEELMNAEEAREWAEKDIKNR